MKICLINPAWRFVSRADVVFSNNLALGYLAGYLRQSGQHTPVIVDALAEGHRQIEAMEDGTLRVGLPNSDIVARIPAGCGMIGITVPFSHLASEVEALTQLLKRTFPQIPVVWGGVHPSTCPEEFPQSAADYWLVGEGEHGLLALADGQEPETLNGILSRKRPSPDAAGKAWRVENLDDIPLPARDLMPMDLYLKLSQRRVSHKPSASVITSRGCPWDCQFCSVHPVSGYRWRGRTAANVLQEIRVLIEDYGVRQIEFEDDNLTLNRKRAKELFEGLIDLRHELKVDLTWGTPNGVRCEAVDREMLKLMMHSGCIRITYALEHGDPAVRESMCKKLDIEKFERAVCNAIDIGLHVEVFTMVGYPGETAERFENSLRYYRQLWQWGVAEFHFFYPQPYPGTRLHQLCRERNYLVGTDRALLPVVKIETEDFDTAEVVRRRQRLLTEFDRGYSLRQRVKSILPARIIEMINRYLPQKAM